MLAAGAPTVSSSVVATARTTAMNQDPRWSVADAVGGVRAEAEALHG